GTGGTAGAGGTAGTGGTAGAGGTAGTGGTGGVTTSCSGGVNALCGPAGNQDCCDYNAVPGGTHNRSYDSVYFTDATKSATVTGYQLGAYEVTVGRFRRFVEQFDTWRGDGNPLADAGAHPLIAASGWQAAWPLAVDAASLTAGLKCDPTGSGSGGPLHTWTDTAAANESRPINCVTWYEAFAFCAFEGARLPTNAEWDRAAAGGEEQRIFPWSSPATDETINYTLASYHCGVDGDDAACEVADLANAGSRTGAGRWGHFDLGGNVWEMVLDYNNTALPAPCTDCADLTPNTWRTIRGGGFTSWGTGTSLRVGTRSTQAPAARLTNAGFRCAKD
ncbi:MAG: formylglycine-generating enzyme family protein, partial [Polyangiaceae bacterium]